MTVICKPLIYANGTPRAVAHGVWEALCAPGGRFPKMAARSADCALAFIRQRPDGRGELMFLQCMRIHFDGQGRPYSWNMSTLHMEDACPLGPAARPHPRYTKYRQEPHYWYPDTRELERMARALAPRETPDLKAALVRATLRPSLPALPPFMVPAQPPERRAEG